MLYTIDTVKLSSRDGMAIPLSATSPEGMIQTVCGPMPPAQLGPTLMHEHILWDITRPDIRALGGPEVEITLENTWDVNFRSYTDLGNRWQLRRDVAERELARVRDAGGQTIVDLTVNGIRPDPEGLRAVSRATGVAIVLGCGYYVDDYMTDVERNLGTDRMARFMVDAVTSGFGETGVQAGIIGEIGCSWPLRPFEIRALQAAAQAQRATGAAVNIHPGRDPRAPFEILDIFRAAGGDPSRLIVSHIDRTLFTLDDILRLADTGCVVEFDFFGIETSYFWFGDADLPTDYMRLGYIRGLFERGHRDQVAISQDICSKTRLTSYGGHGYTHIFRNVLPLMRKKGFDQAEIDHLLIATPRRLLSVATPAGLAA